MKRILVLACGLAVICACGGGGGGGGGGGYSPPASPPAIYVSISPSTQSNIDQGQTVKFAATLTNDTSGQGVKWSAAGTGVTGAVTHPYSAFLFSVYPSSSVLSVVNPFLYILCLLYFLHFFYFFASLSNFTRVYKTRNPCLIIFLCDTAPPLARLAAISHPASAALCNRACSSAVCTPRFRKSGNVLAPNNPATVPRNASVAPPATRPSIRAK